jgi:hypothetical protein
MKILREGHKYELESFEGDEPQEINFIEKTLGINTKGSSELFTYSNGTTNEEMLKVLIDRMQYLNKKCACRENSIVITKLEEALMWLEKRTAGRVARGVEGKPIA